MAVETIMYHPATLFFFGWLAGMFTFHLVIGVPILSRLRVYQDHAWILQQLMEEKAKQTELLRKNLQINMEEWGRTDKERQERQERFERTKQEILDKYAKEKREQERKCAREREMLQKPWDMSKESEQERILGEKNIWED